MSSHQTELSAWRSTRMSVMRIIVLHQYTKFEVHRLFPVPKIWLIFGHGVNRPPGDLDLFDLLMGSRVTRVMGFLPVNFQLPMPFRSRLSQ